MVSEWLIGKCVGRSCRGLIWSYISAFVCRDLEKPRKFPIRVIGVPSEYRSEALPLELTCSVAMPVATQILTSAGFLHSLLHLLVVLWGLRDGVRLLEVLWGLREMVHFLQVLWGLGEMMHFLQVLWGLREMVHFLQILWGLREMVYLLDIFWGVRDRVHLAAVPWGLRERGTC
jgi:hypothetical protein